LEQKQYGIPKDLYPHNTLMDSIPSLHSVYHLDLLYSLIETHQAFLFFKVEGLETFKGEVKVE